MPQTNLALSGLFYDYYKRETDLAHHLEGLKRAGVPEWPYGFRGRVEDRVVGAELEALTFGQTWLGRVEGGTPFLQQFGPGDRVAYRTASTLLTGRARLENNRLCLQYEGYFLDRTLCGEVYRNTTGDAGSRYVSISPDALRLFSTKDEGASRP